MSKICQITHKKPQVGNNVSHANNKRRRRFLPNLQKRRIWVASLECFITLRLSTKAMRTIDKNGIDHYLANVGEGV